ncbi:MAG: hypothetical protein BA865_00890 [Desulfobacterales bacterium S5133MH4]|nr:MAG: hypothetical protein BA865_00890 [Desulfobacterales bacterium S5133MH4]
MKPILYLISSMLFLIVCICSCSTREEPPPPVETEMPKKLTQFTFMDRCSEEDGLLAEIHNDMKGKATILDLMKLYSDELAKDVDVNSPYFQKLQRIFDCGITPETMSGYLHGAVIAFRNEAMLKVFDVNTLNLKWPLARIFSPWTGKTFEEISLEKLKAVTDGFEKGETPAVWGSNTYTTRSTKKRVSVELMKTLGIELIDASPEEIQARDYNVKGFFLVGKRATSVNPANKGRNVFQFNYRWPALQTFPPDNYCIDEMVQIAEGLYLGQLLYATDITKAYDPTLDPRVYKYKNFGYWMLMDDDWHKRRMEISFDVSP